ncbi:autotransporter domain-containing protein, partial [Vibrio cholerae]|uniref:autotransporter domain-containing protein n=1 Tax=Vibrio cholerae TaxID=666 RepID=UPI001C0FD34D
IGPPVVLLILSERRAHVAVELVVRIIGAGFEGLPIQAGGKLDFDNLKRKFALGVSEGSEKGDTDGWLWALSGRVGYDIAAPGSDWHLSPFISADYA